MRRTLLAVVSAFALAAALVPVTATTATARKAKVVRLAKTLPISVLSNRADLISGGDALVRITLPGTLSPKRVKVMLGHRDISRQFARRADGSFGALVTGLALGGNTLSARAVVETYKKKGRKRTLARVTTYSGSARITNHRNGGPIFSGPQWVRYQCQPGVRDAQCNQPATYAWLYKSTDPAKPGLQPFDPARPAADVATTTTDRGVRVPFIVRAENGFQDRDRYTILQLFQPGKPWTPWAPQAQWNRKVLATHGGGCGAAYSPGTPRLEDYSGTIPTDQIPVGGVVPENSYVHALSKGFAVVSTALNNTGHNCSVATEAESMMMIKERLVEQYGAIRYLIGTGCSGGSIAQHTIANAYPGIYQGLITTCSYPDVLTAGAQFADYHLLRGYFENPAGWGAPWLPTQMAAVEGHLSHVNAVVADEGLFKSAINPETACSGVPAPVAGDRQTRFDSEINPGGVRCDILSIQRSILGLRPASAWSPTEKAAGTGFVGVPFANVGLQYGLAELNNHTITPAQFLDLNKKIGGLDINADPTPERIAGDPVAIANAYRSGLINEANHLDEVAMINHGGPDPGLAHDYAHAWWTQTRLQRDQGHTGNRVMWFGAVPLIGDLRWANEALDKMDAWLSAVEKDTSATPLARKIVIRKPAGLGDRCANIEGLEVLKTPDGRLVCQLDPVQQALTRLSTPREQAGDDIANDRVACQLKAVDPGDYRDSLGLPTLSATQIAVVRTIFPSGVCDFAKPGQGQGPATTWLSYNDAAGQVVYGGRKLPAAPAGSGDGWMATAFRGLWRK